MKRNVLIGLVAFGCYVFFLVLQCPAAKVLGWFKLPAGLVLNGPSGSLWQGELESLVWQGKTLRKLSWRVPFTSLLLFDPVLELSLADRDGLRGQAEIGWKGKSLRLRDVDLSADAEWVQSQVPYPVPFTSTGTLRLQLAELQVSQTGCEMAAGQLQWRAAGLTSPVGPVRLDTVNSSLSCEQGKLVAKLKQASSQLKLEGRGEWAFNGQYRFQGSLQPGSELPSALQGGLNMLGKRDSQGAVRLDYNGRF